MNEMTNIENMHNHALESKHTVVMDVQGITKRLPLGRKHIDILKGISSQIRGPSSSPSSDPPAQEKAPCSASLLN